MTSSFRHVEPLLQTGLASLKTLLPGALTDQETLSESLGYPSMTLDPPDPVNGYALGGSEPYVYPLVEIAVPDLTLHGFSLAQVSADQTVTVLVRCQVTDATPELIYIRCIRYGAALGHVVMQPNVFGQEFVLDPSEGLRFAYRGWNIETEQNAPPQRAGGVLIACRLDGGEVR